MSHREPAFDDPIAADTSAGPHARVAPIGAWRAALTRDEMQSLLEMHDWRSIWTLLVNWLLIVAAMAAVAWWPNPLTVIAALFVIGTRQLGLAVVMHEAAHRSFLSDKSWNDRIGSWFAAYPIWSDLHAYRSYHLRHHARTWTEEDPDRSLALPFPITRDSLWRKIGRDLTGRTGLKFLGFSARRDLGTGSPRERLTNGLANPRFRGMLVTNGVLLATLTLLGHPALYLLWLGAYLTTNTLVTRIRSIAEHSMSPDPAHELLNTRTMLASWWERLLIAPNRVNYHLEHHLLMTVPHYHLPKMHALLAERGLLDGALVERSYWRMLARASSKAA